MVQWLMLLFTIIPHELSHVVAWVAMRKEIPTIKLKWYGLLVGEDQVWKLTLLEMFIIAWAGIIGGYFFLLFCGADMETYMLYMVTCAIDFTTIVQILSFPREYSKKRFNLYEVSKAEMKKLDQLVKSQKVKP